MPPIKFVILDALRLSIPAFSVYPVIYLLSYLPNCYYCMSFSVSLLFVSFLGFIRILNEFFYIHFSGRSKKRLFF